MLLLTVFPVAAQDKYSDGFKYWEDGLLTPADFSVRRYPDREGNYSGLSCRWEIKHESVKVGNLSMPEVSIKTKMDKLNSWIAKDYVGSWALRHNQNIFDFYELTGRQLQSDLNNSFFDQGRVSEYYYSRIEGAVDDYINQTSYGTDTAAIAFFEEKLSEQLAIEINREIKIPSFRKTYGVSVLLGYQGYSGVGAISEYISPCHCFSMGVQIGIGDRLLLGAELSGSENARVRKTGISADGYSWKTGEEVFCINIGPYILYRVVDQAYYAISPVLGLCLSDYSVEIPEEQRVDSASSYLSSHKIRAGLQFDWKLIRELTPTSYVEFPITFRVLAERSNLPCIGKAWTISYGVLINLSLWAVKPSGE